MHAAPEAESHASRAPLAAALADAPPGARDTTPWLPVWLLAALGLALRLRELGVQALWFDEVNTLWRAAAGSAGALLARIANDVQAPLYDVLTWAWTNGARWTDAAWVRLPSVLCSTALVPVTALLARELGLRRRGQVLAAAFVALAPFQVRFAQEARPYALLALLSGLLLLGAVRVAASGGRRGLWLLAISGPLLALTHYYGIVGWLAVAAVLLLDAAACGPRVSRLVCALLPTGVAVLAWAPVALRQFRLKEMNSVYRPLDGPALLEVLDAQAVHDAFALGSPALLAGRLALGLLLLAGAWGCWRVTRPRTQPPTPSPSVSCRMPAALLAGLALLVAAGAWLPPSVLEGTAAGLFKGGRALDGENLAMLETLRRLAPWLAAGLLALALLVLFALPAWVRRGGWRLSAVAWPAAAVALPLLAVAVLDFSGKRTLATRNLIGLAPACAVLVAIGLARLRERAPRLEPGVLVLLGALALPSLAALPASGAKADWYGAAQAIHTSGAEPLASPPWVARCVEFHTGRAWNSVFGSRRAEDVRAWAAGRSRVLLVRQFDGIEDSGPIVAELTARFGPPVVTSFRGGLRCELYGTP